MRLVALLFLCAAALLGQSDGIVTTVSRTVSLTPDEADFTVTVSTPLETTQQQVIQILQNAGVQNPTVTAIAVDTNNYLTSPQSGDSQLSYQVYFTTSPGAIQDFSKRLDALRAKPPDGLASLQFSAVLNASQTAIDTAHQAALPQLLQDARTKGQALATAAGLKLGAITGVTESNYSPYSSGVALSRLVVLTGFASLSSFSTATQQTFYATVTFAVQ